MKLKTLDLYVIFSIAMLLLYTVVSLYIAAKYNVQLDVLTGCFFGFFGGEIVTCALIKIFKLKEENRNE